MTLMVMESVPQSLVVCRDVVLEFMEIEYDLPNGRHEITRLDFSDRLIVFVATDRLEFHDVARPEQHHEFAQIADALVGIKDRHRRYAEHLIAARAANRVNAREASAV